MSIINGQHAARRLRFLLAGLLAPAVLVCQAKPLQITTSSLPAGTVGVAYSQALSASGGSPPYSWAVASGALPAGLSLSAGGPLSGTPGTAGSSGFTVRVRDSAAASATAALSLTINPPALRITTTSLPAGTRSEEHTSELQSRQYLVCR